MRTLNIISFYQRSGLFRCKNGSVFAPQLTFGSRSFPGNIAISDSLRSTSLLVRRPEVRAWLLVGHSLGGSAATLEASGKGTDKRFLRSVLFVEGSQLQDISRQSFLSRATLPLQTPFDPHRCSRDTPKYERGSSSDTHSEDRPPHSTRASTHCRRSARWHCLRRTLPMVSTSPRVVSQCWTLLPLKTAY